MKKCKVGNHRDCIEFRNGDFRIAVTTKVGPRIIGCYVGDDENLFAVLPNRPMKGLKNGFRLYGGHRLWHSPEDKPRSYQPDNDPVEISEFDGGIEFSAEPEAATGIRKRIRITEGNLGMFIITHTLENCGLWELELAPWALSVMAPGGMAVIPQKREPDGFPFAPDRSLVLWPYSSYADPRLLMGDNYFFLKQDSSMAAPIKIGFNAESGWIGYIKNGKALIKYFDMYADQEYPDNGCSVESYSCADFCEIETLAPLDILQPGECTEHNEYWQAISGLPEIRNEDDFRKYVEPQLLPNSISENEEDFDYSCCCSDPDCQGDCEGHMGSADKIGTD
ncbi:MAG: hypothetical protein GX946_00805 [Oligosphaeraceae bacterium]|nr:hypothetical protein [Oligosphaeraceae bacterium]